MKLDKLIIKKIVKSKGKKYGGVINGSKRTKRKYNIRMYRM